MKKSMLFFMEVFATIGGQNGFLQNILQPPMIIDAAENSLAAGSINLFIKGLTINNSGNPFLNDFESLR